MTHKPPPPGIRERGGRYQVRFYDSTGQRHSASFARLTDAKRFKRNADTDRDRRTLVDPRRARTAFEDWARTYLAAKLSLRSRTKEKYESSLERHLIPAFGRTPLVSIDRAAVQTWIAELAGRGLAPETIRGHYSLLAAIMGRAAADGILVRSPCAGVELPRAAHTERRFLSADDVERLVWTHEGRYQVAVYVGAYLGLRWQEIAGLKRSALDMRPGRPATLRVTATIERSRGCYRFVETAKTTAGRRTLKVPGFLREGLAWHLRTFSGDQWVFSAPSGGFLRYDNFRSRAFAPAVARAGLAPLTFHELRHTAAAFMVDDGADPLQVKRRMGHEDVRTTFNLYGHLFPDREDELVALLDRRHTAARDRNGDQMGTGATGTVLALSAESVADLDL